MTRKKLTLPDFHFPEFLKKCKRGGPAVVLPKDAGVVLGIVGIGKESEVLELGTGSGFMTCYLANACKKVTTYEHKKEFQELAKANVKAAGFENVEFYLGDAVEGIKGTKKTFDFVFCDIPEAEKIAEDTERVLKPGGYLAAHCLNLEQAKALVLEAEKHFKKVFMLENTVREYTIREFGMRPAHFGMTYSGCLVFAKK